jgi:hypothetical protein
MLGAPRRVTQKITTSILLSDGREKSSNNVYKVKKNNLERGEVEE